MLSLPRYKSHKIVAAAPIVSVAALSDYDVQVVVCVNNVEHAYILPASLVARGWPKTGDYLVSYEDGYLSWSPKAVFEKGYTKQENQS